MADFILIDGDKAIFMPQFGAATVIVQPGKLVASGKSSLNGKKVCIEGDEASVKVAGVSYMTPVFSTPGIGMLKIDSLAGDQIAKHTNSAGKAMLLVGSKFIAKFEVQSPAMQPAPSSVPDTTPSYTGQGIFQTTNTKYKGT